jgi:dienelactone hydrolase
MRRSLRAALGVLAVAALAWGVWRLEQAREGLHVERTAVGTMPVTLFHPAARSDDATAPLAILAHGFAGSQQLMQPLALTLARNGYLALTFDFPGHGRNVAPMTGGLADQQESLRVLLAALERLSAWARPLAAADGGYAMLGHSMASDIVVRHAQAHPEVRATVALSLFAPSIGADTPPDSPRNLLIVDGALEPRVLLDEAFRVVGEVAGDGTQERVTYGRFEDGTARRAAFAPGVEHISVLYSPDTAREALAWLDQAYGRATAPAPFVAAYGPPLAALLAGVLALAWLLAQALPRVAARHASGSGSRTPPLPWGWRRFALLALGPMLATPLLLWKVPLDFLPILLGDYLLIHFALYGVLTAALLKWAGGSGLPALRWPAAVLAAALTAGYGLVAIGVPVDRYLFSLAPTTARVPMILALLAGTLPWFLADEALVRGPRAPRGAYLATKACFLLSLALAIALNPGRLFFLALIVPAILLLFLVYGLFSRWAFHRTGHPAVAALANALVFAWFIGVTFPLMA